MNEVTILYFGLFLGYVLTASVMIGVDSLLDRHVPTGRRALKKAIRELVHHDIASDFQAHRDIEPLLPADFFDNPKHQKLLSQVQPLYAKELAKAQHQLVKLEHKSYNERRQLEQSRNMVRSQLTSRDTI